MRTLKLQVQLSLDSFMAGPNGELEWMTFNWSEDLKNYVNQITEPVDTIILGRKLAEGFIPTWASRLDEPAGEETEFIKKMNDLPKVVFSKTITNSDWDHTVIANGALSEEILQLKRQEGRDIMVYGGAEFVSSLIKERLIDELHLFINPCVLGKGLPIFKEVTERENYQLAKAQAFDCGVAVLVYHLK